jgi:hypothetical protein
MQSKQVPAKFFSCAAKELTKPEIQNLPNNQGREIYREWIYFESEDNVTELQLGVGAKRIK